MSQQITITIPKAYLLPDTPEEFIEELFGAVVGNEIHIVNLLLAAKTDPNSSRDNSGQTALHKAAEIGNDELFDTLLAAKADVNARTKNGETPLYTAVDNGRIDAVKYLLNAKANPNLGEVNGWTPLLLSATSGFENITQLLIHAKANIHQAHHSLTPLYFAAQKGYLDIVKMLVKAGANISLRAASNEGFTPLIVAAETGKLNVVEYLLEEKVDMDFITSIGRSALFHAAKHNQTAVFKTLVKARADIHLSDTNGNTLLHAAVSGGEVEIIQSLIDAKLDVNARNDEGTTPLMAAARSKSKDAILTLLKAGADPNIKTDDETPLHYAVFHEQLDIVKSLLEYKAKPDQRFSSGTTLLSYAQDKHNTAIEEALNSAGASHIPDNQNFFIKPMQKIGLKVDNGGVCHGLVCMAIQDYFSAEGLKKFLDQIESIARTPIDEFKSYADLLQRNRKEWLQRALTEVCHALTKQSGLALTPEKLWLNQLTPAEIKKLLNITEKCDEQILHEKFSKFLTKKVYEKIREYRATAIHAQPELEIPYLFEGVNTYQYLDLYPKGSVIDLQNFLQTLPLYAPESLNPDDVVQLDSVNGIYTKRELEFYFTSLSDAFQKYTGKIAFKLGNYHHFIVIFPSGSSEWQLLNPNEMPICNLSANELAKYILASFQAEQVTGLHLEILVNDKDIDIAKECLRKWKSNPAWQAMHAITPHKAQMVDEFKTSFLEFAVMYNDLPLIKTLLEAKANPNYANPKKFTALRLAAQNGKVEIIKLLQAHRASLEPVGFQGETPLHVATQVGQLETVQYLLKEQVDIHIETCSGYNALHTAAIHNQVDILKALVEAKANINRRAWSNRKSPLVLAAEDGHVETVKALLDMKADVEQYRGVVYCAAENGYTEILNVFLFNAVQRNDMELIELLKTRGSDPSKRMMMSSSEILMDLKQHQPDAVAWFEEYLQEKSQENTDIIEISALELANIMGNEKMIQSLQGRSLFTNNHIFWNIGSRKSDACEEPEIEHRPKSLNHN